MSLGAGKRHSAEKRGFLESIPERFGLAAPTFQKPQLNCHDIERTLPDG
jgi:hypothetical protein